MGNVLNPEPRTLVVNCGGAANQGARMRFLRIGTAGMRGRVGVALTPQLAMDFASAFGTYLDGGSVVVAQDTRISSTMFANAVISALLSCGCDVLNAGVVSAPELHFLVTHMDADGGMLIGAQHHPMGWNALAPVARSGAFLNSAQLQELLDIYHSHNYDFRPWDEIGRETCVSEVESEAYLDAVCSRLDLRSIAAANFTVVADFCNGSGSRIAEKFAARLGIRLIAINKELSGILPHDPEPRPRSSFQVRSIIEPLKADVGFVFNSDMSRTALVTNTGETLSEEFTFPIVADHWLPKFPRGAKVVTNVCTTRTLDEIAGRHGAVVIKTKVGEAHIIDRMIEFDAVLAGDGSGSAAFGGHILGFDNLMLVGLVLEAMSLRRCSSADLVSALPRRHIVKRSIPCPSYKAYSLLRSLRDHFVDAEVTEEDGFRFDWPDGWVHLRASITEPIVRMIVEWDTKEKAEDRASMVRGHLERMGAAAARGGGGGWDARGVGVRG